MKWVLPWFAILVLAAPLYGQAKYQGWCEQGGQRVQTQGQQSTTYVQRSFPACTITVFVHGTANPAALFSDDQGTTLGNPFNNQNRNTGQYFFYAANGRYDVQIAATGLTTFTLFDVFLNDATGGGGPNPPPTPSCGRDCVYPQQFGAKADGVMLGGTATGTGCNGTVGSATITCATANFTAADVGKRFDLAHAGTPSCSISTNGRSDLRMNCNLVGTIQSVTNGTTVVLSTNVLSAVTNEQFAYASSDDAAIQAAINSGAKVIALSGTYGITGPADLTANLGSGMVGGVLVNRAVIAPGPGVGRLLRIGPVAWDGFPGAVFVVENGSQDFTMQGVSIMGTNEQGDLTTFGPTHDGLVICSGQPNNPVICNNLPGNVNGSISDVRFVDCDFSNHWGIGFHQPGTSPPGTSGGVYNLLVSHSTAFFNSYDGFNASATDGLIFNAVNGSYNGTGGVEATGWGSLTITGSIFNHNRAAGGTIGGFNDATSIGPRTCQISGNDFSENGNGLTTAAPAGSGSTIGGGLVLGDGPQNCSVSGNTMRHNHLIGLLLNGIAKDQNYNITGNTLSTNGLINATQVPMGMFISGVHGSTISSNTITNENWNSIISMSRTGNVVTVTTATSHNYGVGYSVDITANAPNATLNATGATVTGITDGTTFTYTLAGADVPQLTMPSGGPSLGATHSVTGGFEGGAGMYIESCRDSQIIHNTVRLHSYANVAFTEFSDRPYLNCLFASDSNTYGEGSLPNGQGRDLYMVSQVGGSVAGPIVPSSAGLKIAVPSQQVSTTACTTAAAPGATCSMTIIHGFMTGISYMNTSTTGVVTACTLQNTPTPQTGNPIILKVTQISYYQATVTIGTYDGQAAGGGPLVCTSNFRY